MGQGQNSLRYRSHYSTKPTGDRRSEFLGNALPRSQARALCFRQSVMGQLVTSSQLRLTTWIHPSPSAVSRKHGKRRRRESGQDSERLSGRYGTHGSGEAGSSTVSFALFISDSLGGCPTHPLSRSGWRTDRSFLPHASTAVASTSTLPDTSNTSLFVPLLRFRSTSVPKKYSPARLDVSRGALPCTILCFIPSMSA